MTKHIAELEAENHRLRRSIAELGIASADKLVLGKLVLRLEERVMHLEGIIQAMRQGACRGEGK